MIIKYNKEKKLRKKGDDMKNNTKDLPITIWERYILKSNEYIFNHIEMGHAETEKPNVISTKFSTEQNDWKNYNWRKRYAKLVNNVVVELN